MRAFTQSKIIPAKVGTQPWLIVLKPGTTLLVGNRIQFRDAEPGSKWIEGLVDNRDPLRITLI
jgi:hypothetical protein